MVGRPRADVEHVLMLDIATRAFPLADCRSEVRTAPAAEQLSENTCPAIYSISE